MAFTEDFDDFIDTDDFGVSATYTPDGGSPVSIDGIFDKEFLAIDEGVVTLSSSNPMFLTKTTNVSSAAPDDTLLVDSVTYKIVEVRPDGTGMTMLILGATS